MQSILAKNIKALRKAKGLTQAQLADKLSVNRNVIGTYEEGRAEPRLGTLVQIAHYFKVSIDELVTKEGAQSHSGVTLDSRVLPIVVDRETDNELITIVPIKASAGYLGGYGDMEYIESLPRFGLPINELPRDNTYRAFQIQGDSMAPIPSGAFIIGSYVDSWNSIKNSKCYVLITSDEGAVFKRVMKDDDHLDTLNLISDNIQYEPYSIKKENVLEMWEAKGLIQIGLSQPVTGDLSGVMKELGEIKSEIKKLR